MNQLQQFQIKLACDKEMFMSRDISVDIYHYTSPKGFESILFENETAVELWASRHDCLNDLSEGTVALERYTVVCNKMLASGELPKDLYDILANVEPPRTTLMWYCQDGTNVLTCSEYVRYVCSFSKNPDSLAMWNYYSKGSNYEGFNLGFFSESLLESVETQLSPYESRVRMCPVVYDCVQQESLIREFILQIANCYNVGDDSIVRHMVSGQLLQWSLVFKNECFKHEEEVRLIVDVGVKRFDSQKEIPQVKTYYRISNGYTVPYIKLRFEKCCLSYVRIGPLMCDAESKAIQTSVIEERLSTNGYAAMVHYSSIPVRY